MIWRYHGKKLGSQCVDELLINMLFKDFRKTCYNGRRRVREYEKY